jgi:predicted DNA-binding antitoxin AbrB/MazE fold protein
MGTTIRVRYSNGALRPIERLDLAEGQELSITLEPEPPIVRPAIDPHGDFLERSFGAWVGLIDGEELKRRIYEARERGSRDAFDK